MSSLLTLIAPPAALTDAVLQTVTAAVIQAGGQVGSADWLSPGEAVDLVITGLACESLDGVARAALAGHAVDAVVQAVGPHRRKAVLVADMDSTMVIGETLDELAAFAGIKDHIAAITARAMNGELDFPSALRERVGLLKGLSATALEQTYAHLELMPGAKTLLATMKAHGAYAVLVSGGFRFFTSRVAETLGFDRNLGNELGIADGVLTGAVVGPILDRNTKLETLRGVAAERGLEIAQTLAVGDGANDLDMLLAAGLGIAYQAKPVVAATAKARVNHGDLTALLFAQGYRRSDFVTASAA